MSPRQTATTHRLLGRTDTHLYLAPHPLLRGWVAHYTLFCPAPPSAAPGASSLVLVPDASGCLVLTLDGPAPGCVFWGPTTTTVEVDGGPTRGRLFFVEFFPGGAQRLLGRSMEGLADQRLPLSLLDPPLWSSIEAALDARLELPALLDALDALLLDKAFALPDSPAEALLGHLPPTGLFTVGDLAQTTFYSERQLSRLLVPALGMSVKRYLRLLRVNRAAARLADAHVSLTDLAAELGYFDQSHFVHDFSAVCKLTPGAYRQSLSVFYNEPHKFDGIINS